METKDVISALSALAHPARLAIFKQLVRSGKTGMAAGELAESIRALANTTSTNLGILEVAGLIVSRRDGRYIRYSAHYAATRDLMAYLVEDCCGGHPEICGLLENRPLETVSC